MRIPQLITSPTAMSASGRVGHIAVLIVGIDDLEGQFLRLRIRNLLAFAELPQRARYPRS